LPFRSTLEQYELQAAQLLEGQRSGDAQALRCFHRNHPRFLDEKIPWKPKDMPDSEIQSAALALDDARLTLARSYEFADWSALAEYAAAVTTDGSPVHLFESAVEAVIHGDEAGLRELLAKHPDLARARSSTRTRLDPPVHRATLLHYIAANGVEGYRQITPPNAVAIARILLEAGSDPNALASMYGGECTTMSMLVSSCHPADAGVQVGLVEVLVDFGASVEPRGTKYWTSPLMTALAFGYFPAADALVRRGAKVETLPAAAGLGRVEQARQLLPAADSLARHRALALASQHGHVEIVRMLLDAGEDPSRYNPDGNHAHSTPLHQAVWSGKMDVVQLLVERGARMDLRDTVYQGTPLDWAVYGKIKPAEDYLRAHGAPE